MDDTRATPAPGVSHLMLDTPALSTPESMPPSPTGSFPLSILSPPSLMHRSDQEAPLDHGVLPLAWALPSVSPGPNARSVAHLPTSSRPGSTPLSPISKSSTSNQQSPENPLRTPHTSVESETATLGVHESSVLRDLTLQPSQIVSDVSLGALDDQPRAVLRERLADYAHCRAQIRMLRTATAKWCECSLPSAVA